MRARVSGSVQGVGFRYWTQHEAQRLGLSGYVQNRSDGTVETEAEGDAASVSAFLDWLSTGPEWADVAAVHTTEVAVIGSTVFELRRDLDIV